MHKERVEKLRQEYTDQFVVVDATRPELARFAGMTGRVRTINFNGRALVEFDGHNNRGWFDIEWDYLKVVEAPEPEPASSREPQPEKKAEPAPQPDDQIKLSPLELARMAKEAEQQPPPTGHRPEGLVGDVW